MSIQTINSISTTLPGNNRPKLQEMVNFQNGMKPLLTLQAPEDNFGRVASAIVQPTQSKCYQIQAEVLANGLIVQKGLSGLQILGQIDAQGDYVLSNGLAGNAFHDDHIELLGYQKAENPFSQALRHSERQRAIKGSEIPLIRQQLTSKGLTGQGIKIGILDPKIKTHTGNWENNPHTTLVTQVIQDPVWGITPGALVEDLGEESESDFTIPADSIQAYANSLTADYTRLFSVPTRQIQKVILKNDPSLRVLNMTWGDSHYRKYMDVLKCITEVDGNGFYKFPTIRSAVLGPALYGTDQQKFQAIVNSVDNILDNSAVVQKAYQQFVDQTRQAALRGLIIVVAAGNENNALPINVVTKSGGALDEYAKSPYVITVAAGNTNQSPGAFSRYSVTSISSRGDGLRWNPTITAPGAELGLSFPVGLMGQNLVGKGTSVATPYTCGVIAMMLQRNPWLTFEQVKTKLQNTAIRLPGFTTPAQGAGVINPGLAVLA